MNVRNLLRFLLVFVILLLVGCAALGGGPEPGPVTEAETLLGTWQMSSDFYRFDGDGTSRHATSLEKLDQDPIVISRFWFEDGQYFEQEIEVNHVPSCDDTIGSYAVQMLENGNLKFSQIDDPCMYRIEGTVGEYRRVE